VILGIESLTRRRYAAGERGTDGRWEQGDATDATIRASVQPASDDDLKTLPEGERTRRAKRIYTSSELRLVDQDAGTSADQVQVDGDWYEVRLIQRERSLLAHYRVIVLAVQEGEE